MPNRPMPNRLINEKSPYLLQHAHNPVDWHAWGDEAFETARRLNKPVFLSIGYATCHWCHVMEKESFEDAQAAAALNESFVCIKVDREERPDIDAVYMTACQLAAGRGGWPLNVMLTPEKKPFFAATYIPRESRFGRPGLIDLCRSVRTLHRDDPKRISDTADALTRHLEGAFRFQAGTPGTSPEDFLDQTRDEVNRHFDSQYGGFDSAPKFPLPHRLLFLLNRGRQGDDGQSRRTVFQTLKAMRLGGLWDHVGFGFHRYATDREWLVPHFEKMLYDQALLVLAYLDGFETDRDPLFAETVADTLVYVQRDLTDPGGGFYSAQDADSEGEEGKFYVWSQAEFEQVAAEAGGGLPWDRILNVTGQGNFLEEATRQATGMNILHLKQPLEAWARQLGRGPEEVYKGWDNLRQALFSRRTTRIHPLRDDKILTDWNGLMIAALARAGAVLEEPAYTEAARRAAGFINTHLVEDDGALLHRFRGGEAAIAATANDYAFFIMGLLALSQAGVEACWLEQAVGLQQAMNDRFWDSRDGGFYLTSNRQNELPVRPKEVYDGALPSANGVALHNLVHLGRLSGDPQWSRQADQLIHAFAGSVRQQPAAFLHTLHGWALQGVR